MEVETQPPQLPPSVILGFINRFACNTFSGLTVKKDKNTLHLCNWRDDVISVGTKVTSTTTPTYATHGWVSGSSCISARFIDERGYKILRLMYKSRASLYKFVEFKLDETLLRESTLGYLKSGIKFFYNYGDSILPKGVGVKYIGGPAPNTSQIQPLRNNPARACYIIAVLFTLELTGDVQKYIIEYLLTL